MDRPTEFANIGQMTDRTRAKIVGALFIVATAAASMSQVVLGSLLDDVNYLTNFAGDQTQIRVGAVLDLVTAAAVVGIPVMLYPILKRHSETVGIGYLISRVLEGVVIVMGAVGLLALLSVSKDFVASGSSTSQFEPLGATLLETRDLTDALATQLIFGLTAVILNYSFFTTKVVPRFISMWGLIGSGLMVIAGFLGLFGWDPFSTLVVILVIPLAVNEMVLAIWLIVKGFTTTTAGTSPRREVVGV